jgi:hypothetical protein
MAAGMRENGTDTELGMEASAFDIIKHASRLTDAGVTQEVANIQAEVLGEIMQAIRDLDTKVEKYHAEIPAEFANIGAQLYQIEARVTKELAE